MKHLLLRGLLCMCVCSCSLNAIAHEVCCDEYTSGILGDIDDPNHHRYLMIKQRELENMFHNISWALYLYWQDMDGRYPSAWTSFGNYPPDPNAYAGANVLAEALFGLDLLGVHQYSRFRSDGLDVRAGESLYLMETGYTKEVVLSSLTERHPSFLDLDEVNVFRMNEIYEHVGPFNPTSLVLCDVFEKERHSGLVTGMPILYFKARIHNAMQDHTDSEGIEDDIYYYPENQALIALGTAGNSVQIHPLADDINDLSEFEELILDDRIKAIKRPHRSTSFILQSAGPDGLYGTEDDIFNFE